MAGENGIWYVVFPTYQYNENVQALAKEAGLRVLDARFDAGDGAKDVPSLTLKDGKAKPAAKHDDKPELFDVYRVVDGKQNERASKSGLTQSEAITYVDDRPENTYEIQPADE